MSSAIITVERAQKEEKKKISCVRSVKFLFFKIISYFLIKVKSRTLFGIIRSDRFYLLSLLELVGPSLVSGNEESAREGQDVVKKFHMGYAVGISGADLGHRPVDFIT